MTERQPSVNKRLEEKVDILTVGLYSMQGDIKAILERMEMQPKIDQQSFDNLKQSNSNCQASNNIRFGNVENDVKGLKENLTWLVRTVIGEVIAILILGIGWMNK